MSESCQTSSVESTLCETIGIDMLCEHRRLAHSRAAPPVPPTASCSACASDAPADWAIAVDAMGWNHTEIDRTIPLATAQIIRNTVMTSLPCAREASGLPPCYFHMRRRHLFEAHILQHRERFALEQKRAAIEGSGRARAQIRAALAEVDALADEIDARHEMLMRLAATPVPARSSWGFRQCSSAQQEAAELELVFPEVSDAVKNADSEEGKSPVGVAGDACTLTECDCGCAAQPLQDMQSIDSAPAGNAQTFTNLPGVFGNSEVNRTEEQRDSRRRHRARLANAAQICSVCSNVLLMIIKLAAALLSGSLSIIANALDSVLDILSGAVLYYSSKAAKRPSNEAKADRYPLGRAKAETLGVIMFACLMGAFALTLIVSSIQALMEGQTTITIEWIVIGIMIFTVVLKFSLHVFCRIVAAKTGSGPVAAYAQDHLNDVMTNTVAIVAAFCAAQWSVVWWLDASVSICLALYILINWAGQAKENLPLIIGKRAPETVSNRIAWAASHHDPRILAVETVNAICWGPKYFVELHLIMHPSLPLLESHDVAESLTAALEAAEDVYRVHVHTDHSIDALDHLTEHKDVWE